MKGFVPTPDDIVDLMVAKLFHRAIPKPDDIVLDPGCGKGAFIEGIIRWCDKKSIICPKIVGVESDQKHILEARQKFAEYPNIEIRHEDFLTTTNGTYNYIIGNPPYVPITKLSEDTKLLYRSIFQTARGRFDLYLLFYEQALKCLKQTGRLVFITPEKYLYVNTATVLRTLICQKNVKEIHLIDENTFDKLTTYPTVTTIINQQYVTKTKVILRNNKTSIVKLPRDGQSWLPAIFNHIGTKKSNTLQDISIRISCGVATGADSIFVKKTEELDSELLKFAYPTISGRQLKSTDKSIQPHDSMIVPYMKDGPLIPEYELGYLSKYLAEPSNYKKLMSRTCVARKPWYAFHETPQMSYILGPKIICKDITADPHFWIDKVGHIVPRHSVYYIVPKNPNNIELLCEYLNSEEVRKWLQIHCQRAANGFIRLQSTILKKIPIPDDLVTSLSY